LEPSDFSFSCDHATLVPVFKHPSIALGVAGVPGDAPVASQFVQSNITLMAYAHAKQNHLCLLVSWWIPRVSCSYSAKYSDCIIDGPESAPDDSN